MFPLNRYVKIGKRAMSCKKLRREIFKTKYVARLLSTWEYWLLMGNISSRLSPDKPRLHELSF